jgi:predicted  nucleic acid-binding Zn-ribbon protein
MSNNLTQNLNGSLEKKVDRLIIAVQSMDSRLTSMDSRLTSMDSRLGELETKVEERLKDTRPMWEAVQVQLAEVESSLRREIRSEVQGLRSEMEKGFRLFDRRIEHYLGEFDKLRGYQRDLEYRVDEIEKK